MQAYLGKAAKPSVFSEPLGKVTVSGANVAKELSSLPNENEWPLPAGNPLDINRRPPDCY